MIVYILEEQNTNQYNPNDIKKLWGVFTSIENAQDVYFDYIRTILKISPIEWVEDTRGFVADGKRVLSATVYCIVLSAPVIRYMHIVPMFLDFDVPNKEGV